MQSILVKNIENHQDEFLKKIIKLGNDYTYKRRFMLGEGLHFGKMMQAKLFYKMLCTDNCELQNFIWDKINGKLKDKCTKDKPLKFLIEQYKKECNKPNCTDSEVIQECVGKIEW